MNPDDIEKELRKLMKSVGDSRVENGIYFAVLAVLIAFVLIFK